MHRILAVTCLTFVAASAVAEDFQAVITKRTIKVKHDRLVAMAGGQATDPAKVFAIPLERFESLAATPNSGVTVTSVAFPMSGMKVRMDGVGPNKEMYVLIDYEKGVTQLVKPSAKTYVRLNVTPVPDAATPSASTPALRPLNKSLKINGFGTTAYELKLPGETALIWLSSDNADLVKFYRQARTMLPNMKTADGGTKDLATELASAQGIPVRVQVLNAQGYTVDELVKVEKKSFPADTFTIPSGFQSGSMGSPARH